MKKEIEKGYETLLQELPELKLPENTPDINLYNKLVSEADAIEFFDGPEMDGVNLSQAARRNKIINEAQKYHAHTFTLTFECGHTADARKRLVRVAECECGKTIEHAVSDELSESAIWR